MGVARPPSLSGDRMSFRLVFGLTVASLIYVLFVLPPAIANSRDMDSFWYGKDVLQCSKSVLMVICCNLTTLDANLYGKICDYCIQTVASKVSQELNSVSEKKKIFKKSQIIEKEVK